MYSNTRKATGTRNEMSNEGFTKEGAANRRDLKLQQNEQKGLITLRQSREYAGLSVKKAAEKLGITESTLREYEEQAGKTKYHVAQSMVILYGVPSDLIHWGAEEAFVDNQQADPFLMLDEICESMKSAGRNVDMALWWHLVLPVLKPSIVERIAMVFEEFASEEILTGPIAMMKESFDAYRQQAKEGARRG